jgi:hypothetical protein
MVKGFKLRRGQVIECLKQSNFIEVVDDKAIRRRVPWDGTWASAKDDADSSGIQRILPESVIHVGVEEPEIKADEEESNPTIPPPGYRFDKKGYMVQISPVNVCIPL